MRHIRARRRFKLFLIAVLAASFLLFFEAKVESFAPQLRGFAESRIEEMLGEGLRLSIRRLDGGIFHPFTANDCRITDEGGRAVLSGLEINSIRSNYRLWDAILKRNVLPIIDVAFASNDGRVGEGFVRMEGDLESAKITGYIKLFGKERANFIGTVNGANFGGEIKTRFGILKADGVFSRGRELNAVIKINHLRLNGFDVVADLILKNEFATGKGEFETKNLIINYRPFLDVKASYEIEDGVLHILNLEAGNDFRVRGKADLKGGGHNIDIVVTADNANLSRVMSIVNTSGAIEVSGAMNGRFQFTGPIESAEMDAKLEIRHGRIDEVDFDLLTAHLKGECPIIKIEESRITRPAGYLMLAGEIDFSKVAKGNIFENVKMISDDMALVWDGWDAKDVDGIKEIRMEKKMSDELRFGFKRFVTDKRVDESLREKDRFELEYKLHPHNSLKVEFGDGYENFFGYEYDNNF